ncbi:MAG: DUF1707 domain-containing protein [Actinomycetota bacterium]
MPGGTVRDMTARGVPGHGGQRISDGERELAAEHLGVAAGEGRISLTELDTRLGAVFAAVTYADLAAVTADLPLAPELASAAAPPQDQLRLAVSKVHVERLGEWDVPRRIDLILADAAAALDFRTPSLPAGGVLLHIEANRSSVRLLAAHTTPVNLENLGRHQAKVADRRLRPARLQAAPAIMVTGDLRSGSVKVLRPRR